jgi:hypothetical protein
MGRGIARAARDSIEGIDKKLGNKIRESCGHLGIYGVMPADPDKSRMVAFQVKDHFRERADLNIIRHSAEKLSEMAEKHSDQRFDLNFPGIGNGGLEESDVFGIVETLPENVHVWRFPGE